MHLNRYTLGEMKRCGDGKVKGRMMEREEKAGKPQEQKHAGMIDVTIAAV
jgi:hypothetical protein